MARRSTNRVPLIKGPTGADSSPKEKVLARRVAQLEQSTGAVEFSGQDEVSSVVVEGGTSTTVNNVYNITTGGGAGTAIVIGGTGAVTSGVAGLPSTIEPQGFYGHAVGTSLRSSLTSAGHSLQGVYSSDGSTFRPIDSLSVGYPVTSYLGFTGDKDSAASGPDFDVPTFAVSDDYHIIYLASAGVTLALHGGDGGSYMYLYELFSDGSRTLIAGASVGYTAGALYLGDDRTSGYGYFAARSVSLGGTGNDFYYLDGAVSNIGVYGVAVYYVDFGALYTAWQSSGVVQSLRTFHTFVGKSNSSTIYSNMGNVSGYRSNPTPWAGALTGHTYAYHCRLGKLFTFNLSNGAASMSSLHIPFGSVEEERSILIASPRWGNSSVDVFLGRAHLDDGTGTGLLEYRVVKHGTWGYVDVTPVGSGTATVTGNFGHPGVVPLSDSATMFFGGAPTHATWYHPFDGGTVYVDLSTL